MDFYTVILRQSENYWVSLCLENGIVGQGETQEIAIEKLKDAVDSFYDCQEIDVDQDSLYCEPISIKELHEFLALESQEPTKEVYEFRAVYA